MQVMLKAVGGRGNEKDISIRLTIGFAFEIGIKSIPKSQATSLKREARCKYYYCNITASESSQLEYKICCTICCITVWIRTMKVNKHIIPLATIEAKSV